MLAPGELEGASLCLFRVVVTDEAMHERDVSTEAEEKSWVIVEWNWRIPDAKSVINCLHIICDLWWKTHCYGGSMNGQSIAQPRISEWTSSARTSRP